MADTKAPFGHEMKPQLVNPPAEADGPGKKTYIPLVERPEYQPDPRVDYNKYRDHD